MKQEQDDMNKLKRPKNVPQKLMCVCVQKREKYIATIVKIILMGKHELNVLETLKSTHAFQI